jgi:HD-GYP domain-containing protein (c-di-GMP phosphodiesterase class II)
MELMALNESEGKGEVIGMSIDHMKNKNYDKVFVPVDIRIVSKIKTNVCHLYIQLASEKHVKFANKGDPLDATKLEKFKGQGIKEIYVEEGDHPALVAAASQQTVTNLTNILDDVGTLKEPVKSLDLTTATHKLIHKLMHQMGINEQIVELTQSSIKHTLKVLNKKTPLGKMVQQSLKKENYISSHCMAINYISCSIANQFPWDSKDTQNKLSFASFCHDLILENPLHAKIRSTNDPEFQKLDFRTQNIIKTHPGKAAGLVQSFPQCPPDVQTIIAQHHERWDGSGFPRGLSGKDITPLSAIFIVAEDFVDQLFDTDDISSSTRDSIIQSLESLYPEGHFAKAVAALKTSF